MITEKKGGAYITMCTNKFSRMWQMQSSAWGTLSPFVICSWFYCTWTIITLIKRSLVGRVGVYEELNNSKWGTVTEEKKEVGRGLDNAIADGHVLYVVYGEWLLATYSVANYLPSSYTGYGFRDRKYVFVDCINLQLWLSATTLTEPHASA